MTQETTEARYTVTILDDHGLEHELEADTVEGIALQLVEIPGAPRKVDVRSRNGELRGWAYSTGDWRGA